MMNHVDPKMTDEEAAKVGASIREALDGNMVVGAFAAEMIGESYPFSKKMWDIVFKGITDLELGRKFEKWADR